MKVNDVEVFDEVLPWELAKAPVRHRLVRRLVERLTLAYGLTYSGELFESGWLFDRNQHRTRYALARGMVWLPTSNTRVAQIDQQGRVIGSHGATGLFLSRGAIVDDQGDTVALVEMAEGFGCPAEFLPSYVDAAVDGPGQSGIEPIVPWLDSAVPDPSGLWSDRTLDDLLA